MPVLKDDIKEIKRLAGLTEQGELTDDDPDTREDQINAALPRDEDKRWSVELNDPDEPGTLEIWVETYDVITMEEVNAVATIVAKFQPIQFYGIGGMNRYLKFVFKVVS